MARVKPGDLFETGVRGKLAYVQYVNRYEPFGDLLRVFTALHDERVADRASIARGASFRVFYPLREALTSTALLAHAGSLPLRRDDRTSGEPETLPHVSHDQLIVFLLQANGIEAN